MELDSHCSTSYEAPHAARAVVGWPESIDRPWAVAHVKRERGTRDRARESGRETERARKHDDELCSGLGLQKWRSPPGRPSIGRETR